MLQSRERCDYKVAIRKRIETWYLGLLCMTIAECVVEFMFGC